MPDPIPDLPPDTPITGRAAPPVLPPELPDPPPVRLEAIADVTLLSPPAHAAALDRLYLDILGFHPADPVLRPPPPDTFAGARRTLQRLPSATEPVAARPVPPLPRTYLAENFALHYLPTDQLRPDQIKVLKIRVPSHAELIQRLLEHEIPYQVIRGLAPGLVHLELNDPAGHLVQIIESPRTLPL